VRNFFLAIWKTISCLVVIFWLSVIKVPSAIRPEGWLLEHTDKIVHCFLYAVLTFSSYQSYIMMKGKPHFIFLMGLCFFIIGYGTLIECIQYYLPNRSFDYEDIIANSIGYMLGVFLARKIIGNK